MFCRNLKSNAVRPLTRRCVRRFTENKQDKGVSGILAADNSPMTMKVSHLTNYSLAVLAPVAFVLSPSVMNMPVDLALGVIIPVHQHIGVNGIISDYVPPSLRTGVRGAWLGVSTLMFLGLLRLNVSGDGITETVKSVWRAPAKAEK